MTYMTCIAHYTPSCRCEAVVTLRALCVSALTVQQEVQRPDGDVRRNRARRAVLCEQRFPEPRSEGGSETVEDKESAQQCQGEGRSLACTNAHSFLFVRYQGCLNALTSPVASPSPTPTTHFRSAKCLSPPIHSKI